MRTYGTIERIDNGWCLSDVEPHVSLRLKAIFPRIPKAKVSPFSLTGGGEQLDADLCWFLSRYPMKISDEDLDIMLTRRSLFEKGQAELAFLLSEEWTPQGRVAFREGEAPYVYQSQAAELCRRMGNLLLMDDLGLGKAQPLTSKILTPSGWIRMGDARVGMMVLGRDGRSHRITGVYPQGEKPAYRVTFSDGASVECCDDHLWAVRDQNRRLRDKGWAVKPLKDIARQSILNKAGKPKWEIPLMEPAEFGSRQSLVIPAYVMGVLIGDGYLGGPTVTFSVPPAKLPILEIVSDLVGADRLSGPHGSDQSPQWHIVGESYACNSYRREISRLGLDVGSKERFIPDCYKRASASDRLEILRGLMDTDGSAIKGRVVFHTCSQRLSEDVADVVRSLGGVANVREYDRAHEGKPTEWQVSIRMRDCPFTLPYKIAGFPEPNEHNRPRRYIRSIEPIGSVPQQCISVDAADHLYVTDDFVVTHNTVTGLATICDPQYLPALIVPPTHLVPQWVEKTKEFTHLTTHVFKSTTPYELPKADVYVCPYSKLGGWIDYAKESPFQSIIFDEIQELRNGRSTSKGAAAWEFRQAASLCMGLSATPIYNYGAEIFQILQYIRPGSLGSYSDFLTEWCQMGPGGKWLVKDPAALGTYLRENHIALRRTNEDVGKEYPPLNVITHEISYDEEVLTNEDEALAKLAFNVMYGSFTEKGQAAREFDLRMRQATGVAKAPHVASFVRMLLEAGEPVVLVGWHREVYDIWMSKLSKFNPVLYTGSETPAKKERTKKAFVSGESNLMILSLRSGAGLDGLQARSCTMVFGELDWSPKVHEQCVGRLRRPGQTRQVSAIYLTTDAGSDPSVIGVLGLKASQSAGIVDPLSAPVEQHSDATRIQTLAREYLHNRDKPMPEQVELQEIVPEPEISLLDMMESRL